MTARAAEIVARRLKDSAGPWLFEAPDTYTAQTGKWRAERLLNKLRQRQKAVGITHGGLHTFRHSGASYLANVPTNPMPAVRLQRFLGHRRLTTTEIYLHANVDDLGAALARVQPPQFTQPSATTRGIEPSGNGASAQPESTGDGGVAAPGRMRK